jgi:hypothetical protein
VVIADRLYEFDRRLFGIDEMPEEEIKEHAGEVANSLLDMIATPVPARCGLLRSSTVGVPCRMRKGSRS